MAKGSWEEKAQSCSTASREWSSNDGLRRQIAHDTQPTKLKCQASGTRTLPDRLGQREGPSRKLQRYQRLIARRAHATMRLLESILVSDRSLFRSEGLQDGSKAKSSTHQFLACGGMHVKHLLRRYSNIIVGIHSPYPTFHFNIYMTSNG